MNSTSPLPVGVSSFLERSEAAGASGWVGERARAGADGVGAGERGGELVSFVSAE